MAVYIKKIQTNDGEKQIDYLSLANLPQSLPDTTSEDNGKFLRVSNGKWVKENISYANGVSF